MWFLLKVTALALWKRTFAMMTGGMLAIVLGPRVGLPGTGPLSSIVTGFVASMLWKLQAPLSTKKTVNDIIQGLWVVLCPMLFAFTGSDVDITVLDWYTLSWMIGVVLVTIVVRLLGCVIVLSGGSFNFREMLFVGLIFQGKATNQAALAPQILTPRGHPTCKMMCAEPMRRSRWAYCRYSSALPWLTSGPCGADPVCSRGKATTR